MPQPEPQRLRVLHLGSPTGLYGAERWILALVKHLPAEQVESIVAVIKDEPGVEIPLCEHAAANGFGTHVFESSGRLSFSAVGQLRRFIHEHNIHVLHTHGYKTDIIGCLAARGTACKTVVTPHGWGATAGMKLKVYEALDRVFLRFVDAVVPLSEALYRGLHKLPGVRRKLHLIPNSVDLAEIDEPRELPAQLAAWRAEGAKILGYVGRLDAGKRIDTLLRAFKRLPLSDTRLCIVGEGDERPRLEQLATQLGIAEHVAFLGFRADRLAWMQGFDGFVLPSESEGIPRCLMEAMACGVAAVASDIPGCRYLIEDGKTGLLFPVGDDAKLARSLESLLQDSARRKALAAAGETHIRQNHSAEAMAESYFRLYGALLGETGQCEALEKAA